MQRWSQAVFLSSVALILVLDTGCGPKAEIRPVASSGITLAMLRPGQAEALALTGKVWGFLKYHHPAVTAGKHDWDAALLRVLPEVLAAPRAEEVQRLGSIDECRDCATLEAKGLQTIYRNRMSSASRPSRD